MKRDERCHVIAVRKGFFGKVIFEQQPEGSRVTNCTREQRKSVFR